MTETNRDIAGVIAPPPLIFLCFLLTGIALEYGVVRTQGLDMPSTLRWTLVVALLVAGITFIAAALPPFRDAGGH